MILQLRNRHRSIWMVLPLVFVLAFAGSIHFRSDSLPHPPLPILFEGKILQSGTNDQITASIISGDEGTLQMVLQIKAPITHPVATVYLSSNTAPQPEGSMLLGAAGPVGNYFFPLDSITASWQQPTLFMYDQIRQQLFNKIQLKSR